MEEQRTEYIQATEYERSDERVSQRNGYYQREWTTRIGTLNLTVNFQLMCLRDIRKTRKHF